MGLVISKQRDCCFVSPVISHSLVNLQDDVGAFLIMTSGEPLHTLVRRNLHSKPTKTPALQDPFLWGLAFTFPESRI
jgi:hypothetical protein